MCNVELHTKKFQMGCDQGWFIATKSQVLTGKPTAFIAPFLDLAKITEDMLSILRNPLTRKTTAEWEVIIMEAQEEWEDYKTRHPLRMVEEQSSGEEIDNESMGLTKGELFDGCYLSPRTLPGSNQPRSLAPSTSPRLWRVPSPIKEPRLISRTFKRQWRTWPYFMVQLLRPCEKMWWR